MIEIGNPYVGIARWNLDHAEDLTRDPDVGERGYTTLQHGVQVQGEAFRDGARAQLQACVIDLRTWAAFYRSKAGESDSPIDQGRLAAMAVLLEAFVGDWQREADHTAST